MTETNQIILDMVMQHCHVEERKTVWIVDNSCLSANEAATAYLARRGILKRKKGDRIYSLSKKTKF